MNESETRHKLPISLVIIALNEEVHIEQAIRSADFCSDIVVIDSHSTDRTAALAKALGARVLQEKWRGFRAQKQFAVDQARNDWILSLDADEALSPALADEIQSLWQVESLAEAREEIDGYECARLSFYLGRWIRHGGWYPDRQLRLFHRKRARWGGGENVHERVEAAKVSSLKEDLLHWPFERIEDQIATNNRYSGLGARELAASGRRFSLIHLLNKPLSKFLETYIFKRGFLDGLAGFIISVGAAYSVFLKWAKLWELERATVQPKTLPLPPEKAPS